MALKCSVENCPICRVADEKAGACEKRITCMAGKGHTGDCLRARDVLINTAAALVLRLIDGKRHHER
jgi:hypothetical protein